MDTYENIAESKLSVGKFCPVKTKGTMNILL